MSEQLRDLYRCFRDRLSRLYDDVGPWEGGLQPTCAVMQSLEGCKEELCKTMGRWKGNVNPGHCRSRSKAWLLDFSFSSHDLRQVSERKPHDWKEDEEFHLWLAVESELGKCTSGVPLMS